MHSTDFMSVQRHAVHWTDNRLTSDRSKYRMCTNVRWFFNVVAERHILGVRIPGGGLWSPNSNSAEIFDFCTMHLWHAFTRSEVIVLTNTQTHKHTDAAENIQRSSLYATTLGNKSRHNRLNHSLLWSQPMHVSLNVRSHVHSKLCTNNVKIVSKWVYIFRKSFIKFSNRLLILKYLNYYNFVSCLPMQCKF